GDRSQDDRRPGGSPAVRSFYVLSGTSEMLHPGDDIKQGKGEGVEERRPERSASLRGRLQGGNPWSFGSRGIDGPFGVYTLEWRFPASCLSSQRRRADRRYAMACEDFIATVICRTCEAYYKRYRPRVRPNRPPITSILSTFALPPSARLASSPPMPR